jgi:hypothetical protein
LPLDGACGRHPERMSATPAQWLGIMTMLLLLGKIGNIGNIGNMLIHRG